MAGSLPKTGVEAVVEGLSGFSSDIDKMNSKIGEIGSGGNFLTRALSGAWEMLENLGASAIRVAEFALGQLLANAIEFVISKLSELVSETIEAGAEFQTLQLRLNRLNFNSAMASTNDYGRATALATEATQEQLTWLQKLAVQTPYDAQDIANVFTLARSYGFAADQAKEMTSDIADFAAGMGLGNTEIRRIIVNFGQMQAQGKVTSREMNDLARGAFVPVNDVLERMQKNTGLAGAAFDSFRSTGEGVQAFFTAFSDIVGERFSGATVEMARTLKGATDNMHDFFKSIIGFNVVKPILDEVGGRIADFLNATTEGNIFNRLNTSAALLGDTVRGLLSDILDIFTVSQQPITLFDDLEGLKHDEGGGGIGDKIVEGLAKIRSWIDTNRDGILAFFQNVKDKALEIFSALKSGNFEGFLKAIGLDDKTIGIITKFKDGVIKAFDTIKGWVDSNGELISKFFETLGNIIGGVFENLGGDVSGGGLESFLTGVTTFMQYIVDNQESITTFVTILVQLWGVLQIIGLVLSIIIPPIIAFLGFIISLVAAASFLVSAFEAIVAVVTFLLSPIGLLIALLAILAIALIANWENIVIGFNYLKEFIAQWWTELWSNFSIGVAYLMEIISQWVADMVTKFLELKTSLVAKIEEMKAAISAKFTEIVAQALDQVEKIKATFMEQKWYLVGERIIQGISKGIYNQINALVQAAVSAAQAAINAVTDALDMNSPSKVFMKIGELTIKGMIVGIDKMADAMARSMEAAVTGAIVPAANMPSMAMSAASAGATTNNSNTVNNNFGLTVNSSASAESVVQDYGMLQSLVAG